MRPTKACFGEYQKFSKKNDEEGGLVYIKYFESCLGHVFINCFNNIIQNNES